MRNRNHDFNQLTQNHKSDLYHKALHDKMLSCIVGLGDGLFSYCQIRVILNRQDTI